MFGKDDQRRIGAAVRQSERPEPARQATPPTLLPRTDVRVKVAGPDASGGHYLAQVLPRLHDGNVSADLVEGGFSDGSRPPVDCVAFFAPDAGTGGHSLDEGGIYGGRVVCVLPSSAGDHAGKALVEILGGGGGGLPPPGEPHMVLMLAEPEGSNPPEPRWGWVTFASMN